MGLTNIRRNFATDINIQNWETGRDNHLPIEKGIGQEEMGGIPAVYFHMHLRQLTRVFPSKN